MLKKIKNRLLAQLGLKLAADKTAAYEAEIAKLQAEIQDLEWDTSFGMYNSAGLVRRLNALPKDQNYGLAYLDLNCLHHLNNLYGYDEVNRRIKATFTVSLRPDNLIGRVFSGDEILVVAAGGLRPLKTLLQTIQENGMTNAISFMSVVDIWNPAVEVEPILAEMGRSLLARKQNQRRLSNRITEGLSERMAQPA